MTKTILIVEDDPFIAMDLHDTFEEAGYRVLGPVAAVNPGLKIIKDFSPDVAMLDYNLGRETSLAIAHKLDANSVPYIFLSGQIDEVVTAGNDKSKMVLTKPFNPTHLIETIDSLVHNHSER